MNSLRDKLTNLDNEIKDVQDKQSALYEQDYSLQEARHVIIKNILAEEKPLQGTKWELFVSTNNNNIFLQYIDNTDNLKNIHNLCFQSYHDSFDIEEGITFRFDDYQYSLCGDPGQLKSFAIKQNLIIIAKDIDDKIQRLSRQLTNLQEICHQFNLKTTYEMAKKD